MRKQTKIIVAILMAFTGFFIQTGTAEAARVRSVPANLTPAQQKSAQAIRVVFPDHMENYAIRVAYCESRLKANARNGPHRGLFQINYRLHRPEGGGSLYNATVNAKTALRLVNKSGWRPWSCR